MWKAKLILSNDGQRQSIAKMPNTEAGVCRCTLTHTASPPTHTPTHPHTATLADS